MLKRVDLSLLGLGVNVKVRRKLKKKGNKLLKQVVQASYRR